MNRQMSAKPDVLFAPDAKRPNCFADSRDKALQLFASKGFAEVGMRELAACMGVTPGALYHHYPSKQHLLFDFVEEFYQELLAAFSDRRARQKKQALEIIIGKHLDLYDQLPWHFKVTIRDGDALTLEHHEQVLGLRRQYYRKLGMLLGFGAEPDGEAMAVVHAIAMLLNTAPSWLYEPTLPYDVKRSLARDLLRGAIEEVMRGLRSIEATPDCDS